MNAPLKNPSIIADMPMQSYLAHYALSSTALVYLDQSPRHYRYYRDGKISIEGKHLELGTALHLALESKQAFEETYILRPEGMDKRTKAGKEAFAKFEVSAGAKTILERDDFYRITGMVNSLQNTDDPVLQSLMRSPYKAEHSFFWDEFGVHHKCRPDRLIQPSGNCVDLINERWPDLLELPFGISICMDFKTTSKGASPKKFSYACNDYGYYLKAAHYLAGTKADLFCWVAIESSAPYNCALYWFNPNKAEGYLKHREQLIEMMKRCNKNNQWTGYSIPPYAQLLG